MNERTPPTRQSGCVSEPVVIMATNIALSHLAFNNRPWPSGADESADAGSFVAAYVIEY